MRDERIAADEIVVLFADDDDAMRGIVRDALEGFGFRVELACDGRQALEHLAGRVPNVIITDFQMPDGGLDLVSRLRDAAPGTPIIVVSSFGDASVPAQSRLRGATEFFSKPVRMGDLALAVRRLAGDCART